MKLTKTKMYSDFKTQLEKLPKIKKEFIVNNVEFVINYSYLSIVNGEYTKHEVKNIKSGKTAIVKHDKIKEYL